MLRPVPAIRVSRRARTPVPTRRAADRPRIVVVGDIVVDVVLAPDRPMERGTDVPGRVFARAGGSAATAARWIGRLGARSTLVCAVGRDAPGRALVESATADGVTVRAVRVAGARTGRIGVLVDTDGQRSFVQDRGAALRLRPEDLRRDWFADADAVHLPAYSLLGEPLGRAGTEAIRIARETGALVTVDLASTAPLLALGRRSGIGVIRAAAPDLLFATRDEAKALLGHDYEAGLLELAPIAVVKRGRKGASIHIRADRKPLRLDVATTPIVATDTTGAGDAFDAGFLVGWLDGRRRGLAPAAALRRGAVSGNRAALRQLAYPKPELNLG
jgi:sugar/nucleoside kinase (ribokinase family)